MELYWKTDKVATRAADFREDTLRYLYMPRLKDRGVFVQAIIKGAGTRDFFGTSYGRSGETYEGFKFVDSNVQFDDTLLLMEPGAAKAYEAAQNPSIPCLCHRFLVVRILCRRCRCHPGQPRPESPNR